MLEEAWIRFQHNWEPKVAFLGVLMFIAFVWWDHRNLEP